MSETAVFDPAKLARETQRTLDRLLPRLELEFAAAVSTPEWAEFRQRLQLHFPTLFPLLLELPSYRWPDPLNLARGLWERIWIFLRRVGTIILALAILLWFLASYPAAPLDATAPAIEYSFAGRLGLFMQPLFAPLGFNWQMCIALIPAMGAREVAVSALSTVYAIAEGSEGATTQLASILGHSWSLPVALAYLAWFVYAPQCLSTIAVVKRETNSWRTTAVFVVYLFTLAYLAAWLTYKVASTVFH